MRGGMVTGFQEYYERAMDKSVALSCKIVEHKPVLKIIEECERAKEKQLPPLKPMLDQLIEYLTMNDIQRISVASDCVTALGGLRSQYYNACYTQTKVMLKQFD